jgi:hypothetical protein
MIKKNHEEREREVSEYFCRFEYKEDKERDVSFMEFLMYSHTPPPLSLTH